MDYSTSFTERTRRKYEELKAERMQSRATQDAGVPQSAISHLAGNLAFVRQHIENPNETSKENEIASEESDHALNIETHEILGPALMDLDKSPDTPGEAHENLLEDNMRLDSCSADNEFQQLEAVDPSVDPRPTASRVTAPKDINVESLRTIKKAKLASSIPDPYKDDRRTSAAARKGRLLDTRAKFDRSKLQALNNIRELIGECKREFNREVVDTTLLEEKYQSIRRDLEKFEFLEVDESLIKQSKLLNADLGLRQLQNNPNFPADIRADAKMIYSKWERGDFEGDMLRGLDYHKTPGSTRNSASFKKTWGHRVNPAYFGDNDLVSGRWWPLLLAAMRDGAHNSPQAGICYSTAGDGAYSVLVAGGGNYPDIDSGENIYYCGVEGALGQRKPETSALFANIANGNPVRVIRSSKLENENPYRPVIGFRYDGLYTVKRVECTINLATEHYRFHLERKPEQEPIRHQGVGRRPSQKQIDEYERLKALSL